jgi:ABC-type taurine transport system ATPase subunit
VIRRTQRNRSRETRACRGAKEHVPEAEAVLVTHDVSEAVALAHRIILLDGGRACLVETIAAPARRCGAGGISKAASSPG